MKDKFSFTALLPLAWGAVLILAVAAVLLAMRPVDPDIPTDAVYVMAAREVAS